MLSNHDYIKYVPLVFLSNQSIISDFQNDLMYKVPNLQLLIEYQYIFIDWLINEATCAIFILAIPNSTYSSVKWFLLSISLK